MEPVIEHTGIVTAVRAGKAIVRIEQLSACAGCHAKGFCTAADKRDKEIEADCAGTTVRPGDRVIVTGRRALGMKAVRLAFVYPALLMLAVLSGVSAVGSETAAAGCTLGALAVYYGILYGLRKRIGRSFVFNLKPASGGENPATENTTTA